MSAGRAEIEVVLTDKDGETHHFLIVVDRDRLPRRILMKAMVNKGHRTVTLDGAVIIRHIEGEQRGEWNDGRPL